MDEAGYIGRDSTANRSRHGRWPRLAPVQRRTRRHGARSRGNLRRDDQPDNRRRRETPAQAACAPCHTSTPRLRPGLRPTATAKLILGAQVTSDRLTDEHLTEQKFPRKGDRNWQEVVRTGSFRPSHKGNRRRSAHGTPPSRPRQQRRHPPAPARAAPCGAPERPRRRRRRRICPLSPGRGGNRGRSPNAATAEPIYRQTADGRACFATITDSPTASQKLSLSSSWLMGGMICRIEVFTPYHLGLEPK
jgi:hypothetical protein